MRGITHKYDGRKHRVPKHEKQRPRVAHGYSLQSSVSQSSGGPGPDAVPSTSNVAARDYRIEAVDTSIDASPLDSAVTAYGQKPPGYDLQGEGGPQIHDTWYTKAPTMGRVIRNEDSGATAGLPSRTNKDVDKVQVGFRFPQTFKGV